MVFAIASVSMLVSQSGDAENCTFYANSMPYDFGLAYGPGCVGTGPGCNECVTTSTRGVKVCVWDPFLNVIYCYYSSQYPDNQI